MAEEALIEARIRFVHNSAVAVYECENCGEWHLTSQGEMNPKLKKLLHDGSIRNSRETLDWEMKIKNG
jgi:hypothetical protein